MTSTGCRIAREQLVRLTTHYDVTATGLSVTDAARLPKAVKFDGWK
jgi:hypothetical protein